MRNKYYIFHLSIILVSGVVLANLPMSIFLDRDNYLNYAENSLYILEYYWDAGGLLGVLFNEPIWLFINIVLSMKFEPEIVVNIIIFSSFIGTAICIYKGVNKNIYLCALIILSPILLQKYIVHLRQGLAISLFVLGWCSSHSLAKRLSFFGACLIHSSFIFVFTILAICGLLKKHFETKVILLAVIGVAISSAIGIVFGHEYFPARQSLEGLNLGVNVSGIGFTYWLFVVSLFFFEGDAFIRQKLFEVSILLYYLTMYFTIGISGRIFESAVVLVLLASCSLTGWRRSLFLISYILASFGEYALRSRESIFGMGLSQ